MTENEIISLAEIIRSGRQTKCVEITRDGRILVRVPYSVTDRDATEYLKRNISFVMKHADHVKDKNTRDSVVKLTKSEASALKKRAEEYIPGRVKYYADIIGVKYGKITIRHQKARWGSCTSKKNLSFNCLLMLTPPDVIDSVVVHELCHIFEMNHSKKFYAKVYKFYPQYDTCHNWLKKNGREILLK